MAAPIYKLWMIKRQTEPYYALSRAEGEALIAQTGECFTGLGGKRLIICDSGWASEQYRMWGIEEYPDLGALLSYHARLNELNWFRYIETESMLGMPPGTQFGTLPAGGIFKLFRFRPTEAAHVLPQAERQALLDREVASHAQLGVEVYTFKTRWANESWHSWGIACYPDLDAEQRHTARLEELSWFRYFEAETLLGTRVE
jgi:hypothetical protein